MTLPNFMVIGAAKAGTTSLFRYLDQHPEVFVPELKEPRFFAVEEGQPDYAVPAKVQPTKGIVFDLPAYERLYERAGTAKAIGDMSTWYLYAPRAAARIRALIPEARIVAILRDPAERAHSAFVARLRNDQETTRDFAAALRLEPQRIRENWEPIWHYRAMGFYHAQLRRYFDLFPRERIQVHLYEDYRDRAQETYGRMFEFLGVDPAFRVDDTERINLGGVPRSQAFHRFLQRPNRLRSALGALLPAALRRRIAFRLHYANIHKPTLDPGVRRDLVAGYRDDILRLQDLIGRDLSAWLR